MTLAEYERAKFELAEILRSLKAALVQPTPAEGARMAELFVRLAEDRFNLVMIGRFSRGKSSLMNAILGLDSLPVGVVPLTSVISTVCYGSEPGARIRYKNTVFAEDIALEALPEYVTQRGNPGNVRGVRTAEIRLPAEILRRGFHLVDTPGLASSIAENTRTTEAFLPEADAFVLVTSYEGPLSEEEVEMLRVALSTARRTFVVVNKHDLVPPAERSETLRDLEERLGALPGAARLRIFSVSARDALQAKNRRDATALKASGVAALERELVQFLVAEKGRELLVQLCRRSEELAREALAGSAGAAVVARAAALALRIARSGATAALETTWPPAADRALRELPACEVCAEIAKAAFDSLCRFQYRLSIDPEVQRAHAERGGFCALHTWQYASLASTQAFCTGYPALLERLSIWFRRRVDTRAVPLAVASEIRTLLPDRRSCELCRLRAQTEAQALARLAAGFARDPAEALGSLSALCMSHLAGVIEALDDPQAVEDLLLREAVILQRLADDMRRYATKHDAVRRPLASGEETRAGRTAVAVLAGLRNVHSAAAYE